MAIVATSAPSAAKKKPAECENKERGCSAQDIVIRGRIPRPRSFPNYDPDRAYRCTEPARL